MKPSLLSDFTVSVRHQIWEESPEVAELYRGIYSVTLNFLVTVMFVPFERTVDNWPPILPENVDEVTSKLEARLFTIALSDYTVTPNSHIKEQQELITLPLVSEEAKLDSLTEIKVVLYVSPQKFEIFSQELSWLAEQTPSVHDYVRISEIENLEIAKFILSDLIGSNHFSAEHLIILRREYEYAQKNLKESRRYSNPN
ncbi:hypothetical protein [Iningainema tapete]|uniref:Uncharacterized protein n=1 Tax=Iningainema tapete BLCC-T55 TaxID=2748662 RepID=A0A8J6XPE3_9CYAN|nr:hypothetical protein [Iningainema tapete]MBD2778898.1 hypothetical protein [Iningainema tapete BLCC-T55]